MSPEFTPSRRNVLRTLAGAAAVGAGITGIPQPATASTPANPSVAEWIGRNAHRLATSDPRRRLARPAAPGQHGPQRPHRRARRVHPRRTRTVHPQTPPGTPPRGAPGLPIRGPRGGLDQGPADRRISPTRPGRPAAAARRRCRARQDHRGRACDSGTAAAAPGPVGGGRVPAESGVEVAGRDAGEVWPGFRGRQQ